MSISCLLSSEAIILEKKQMVNAWELIQKKSKYDLITYYNI
jgi:hypothetical protein